MASIAVLASQPNALAQGRATVPGAVAFIAPPLPATLAALAVAQGALVAPSRAARVALAAAAHELCSTQQGGTFETLARRSPSTARAAVRVVQAVAWRGLALFAAACLTDSRYFGVFAALQGAWDAMAPLSTS